MLKVLHVQSGQDSVVCALNDLRTACRCQRIPGRTSQIVAGTFKAVSVTLLNSLQSWAVTHAALLCMHAVLACVGNASLVFRHEGGIKACQAALKKYGRRPPALQLTCRMFARAQSVSGLTTAEMLKVRPAHLQHRSCQALTRAANIYVLFLFRGAVPA